MGSSTRSSSGIMFPLAALVLFVPLVRFPLSFMLSLFTIPLAHSSLTVAPRGATWCGGSGERRLSASPPLWRLEDAANGMAQVSTNRSSTGAQKAATGRAARTWRDEDTACCEDVDSDGVKERPWRRTPMASSCGSPDCLSQQVGKAERSFCGTGRTRGLQIALCENLSWLLSTWPPLSAPWRPNARKRASWKDWRILIGASDLESTLEH